MRPWKDLAQIFPKPPFSSVCVSHAWEKIGSEIRPKGVVILLLMLIAC